MKLDFLRISVLKKHILKKENKSYFKGFLSLFEDV